MQTKSTRARRNTEKLPPGVHKHGLTAKAHPGKYFAKLENGRDPLSGAVIYKRFGPSFDKDAIIAQAAAHVAARKATQAPQPVGKASGRDLLWWVNQYLALEVKGRKADSTLTLAEQALLVHARPLHGKPLVELNKAVITAWVNSLWRGTGGQLGAATVNGSLSKLKACLEAALDPGYHTGLVINPARSVKPVPADKKDEYLPDPADTVLLVEVLGDSYLAGLPIVATDLGLRRGEICALRWMDIDLSSGKVSLRQHTVTTGHGSGRKTTIEADTKTGEVDPVWLSSPALQALLLVRERLLLHRAGAGKKWAVGETKNGYTVPFSPVAPEALVFPFHNGHMYEPNTLGSWFDGVARRAGVAKTLHSMRHDCGSFLLARGVPITVVSKHLRHASIQTTMDTYLHLLKSQQKDASIAMAGVWDELGFSSQAA